MRLTHTTETWLSEDMTWLASAHGTQSGRSVTLDRSAFTSGTHYPNGYFLAGIPLGKITASGKYGPYNNASSDGTETLAGLLFHAVDAGSTDIDPVAAMLDHCIVVESLLPIAVDSAGKTDVKGAILFR
jgi:hypothetical protein